MGRRMSAPVYLKAAPRTLTIQLTSVANSCNWERKVIADNARVGEQVVILDYVQRGGCRGDADCVAPERVKVLDFLPKRDTQRVRGEPLRGGPGCWQRLPAPWYLSLILHCNDIGLAYASPGYFVSWSRPTLCDRVNLDVRTRRPRWLQRKTAGQTVGSVGELRCRDCCGRIADSAWRVSRPRYTPERARRSIGEVVGPSLFDPAEPPDLQGG